MSGPRDPRSFPASRPGPAASVRPRRARGLLLLALLTGALLGAGVAPATGGPAPVVAGQEAADGEEGEEGAAPEADDAGEPEPDEDAEEPGTEEAEPDPPDDGTEPEDPAADPDSGPDRETVVTLVAIVLLAALIGGHALYRDPADRAR